MINKVTYTRGGMRYKRR